MKIRLFMEDKLITQSKNLTLKRIKELKDRIKTNQAIDTDYYNLELAIIKLTKLNNNKLTHTDEELIKFANRVVENYKEKMNVKHEFKHTTPNQTKFKKLGNNRVKKLNKYFAK